MGRTLPTQIQMLRDEDVSWSRFRRALRREDQDAFDEVWAYARRHSVASSMASRALPFEAHFLSMVVGLQRELSEMEKRYAALLKYTEGRSAALEVVQPVTRALTPPDGEIS